MGKQDLKETVKMPTLRVKFARGKVTNQNVEAIVNSANGMLILGSGIANEIRKAGGKLDEKGKRDYQRLLEKTRGAARKCYNGILQTKIWDSKVQLECLRAIVDNNCKPLVLGEAVLTSSGNLGKNPGKAKWIIHAVGMSYDYQSPIAKDGKPLRKIPATKHSVEKAVRNSLNLASDRNSKSIAIPIMCARSGGLSAEKSFKAIMEAVKSHLKKKTSLDKIIIVGDNPLTEKFIDETKRQV